MQPLRRRAVRRSPEGRHPCARIDPQEWARRRGDCSAARVAGRCGQSAAVGQLRGQRRGARVVFRHGDPPRGSRFRSQDAARRESAAPLGGGRRLGRRRGASADRERVGRNARRVEEGPVGSRTRGSPAQAARHGSPGRDRGDPQRGEGHQLARRRRTPRRCRRSLRRTAGAAPRARASHRRDLAAFLLGSGGRGDRGPGSADACRGSGGPRAARRARSCEGNQEGARRREGSAGRA